MTALDDAPVHATGARRRPAVGLLALGASAALLGGTLAALGPVSAVVAVLGVAALVLVLLVLLGSGQSVAPAPVAVDGAGHRSSDEAGDEDDVVTPLDPVVTLAVTAALVGGTLAALDPLAVLLAAGAAVLAAVVLRPELAAYLWLGVTPLIVGVDRGTLIPLLRPNEVLLAGLVAALVLRASLRWVRGESLRRRADALDVGFALLVLTGSVLPTLWSVARGQGLALADLLSAANVLKYYAVYLLVRTAVRTPTHVRRCLAVTLASCAVVAVLAVLQALRLGGVAELLGTYWATGENADALLNGRGSSTIGHTQGLADVMVFNLAIAVALLLRSAQARWPLVAAAGLFLLGALASGQVSGVAALVVGVVAVGWVVRRLAPVLAAFVLVAPVAVLALVPVVEARLDNLDPSTGLPTSWLARWENLRTYFWPRLFEEDGWLLGVQLVPEAAGREPWQPTVWIESGHTWLLWIGGVPLFVAFFVFLAVALRVSARTARTASGAVAVAGAASFAAWWTVAAGMVFDPHLFLRGSADLSFPLLALASASARIRDDVGSDE